MSEDDRVIRRCLLWSLKDLGHSDSYIAGLVGPSIERTTLDRVLKQYRADWQSSGLPRDASRKGRPSTLPSSKETHIAELLKGGSSSHILADLFDVSHSTILNIAHRHKVSAKIPRIRPFLTQANMEERVARCMQMKGLGRAFIERVMWTDESAVALTPTQSHYQWVDDECEPEEMHKFAYPKTLWIWAGISWHGKTKVIFLTYGPKGGFTAQHYQDQVLSKVQGFMEKTGGPNCMLMEDGSSVHTAKINKQFREQHKIKSIPFKWPAHSPDLNPIENIWAALKYYLHTLQPYPSEVDEMKKAVRFFWKNLTLEEIRSYIDSYDNRLNEVISKNGGSSSY